MRRPLRFEGRKTRGRAGRRSTIASLAQRTPRKSDNNRTDGQNSTHYLYGSLDEMKKTLLAAAFALLALAANAQQLTSPDDKMKLYFRIDDGRPTYTLTVDGRNFIAPSRLGYKLKSNNSEQNSFSEVKSTMPKDQNAEQKADCYSGFQLLRYENNSFDETWRPVQGEESSIRNHCNELLVCLKQSKNDRFMNIRFRLFNDGLGCRYEFPDQKKLTYFVVADELTEFAMTGDHTAWWVAGDYDTQEFECRQTKLSGIRGRMQKAIQATSAGTPAVGEKPRDFTQKPPRFDGNTGAFCAFRAVEEQKKTFSRDEMRYFGNPLDLCRK